MGVMFSLSRTKKVWHFTVEQDIPIMAYTEEEAEKEFHERYGNIPILGIMRPYSYNSSEEKVSGEPAGSPVSSPEGERRE